MIFNMVGGGGGSGATLVVSSPVNVSVTVSKDDKSYTKNSGSLGSTTFKGLATGTWTVTINGNGQTATRTIEITADYAITIAFFSATINITYPANSTCVVTNSGGQTVASDTNTTSSEKTFIATVNATGTYTVTATATDGSGNTKSESVEITSEGQSVSVELSYALVLFGNGNTYDDITGGYQAVKTAGGNGNKSISYTDGLMVCSCAYKSGAEACSVVFCTKSSIDLTDYNAVKITIKSATESQEGQGTPAPCIFVDSNYSNLKENNGNPEAYAVVNVSSDEITYQIDTSKISGFKYIGLFYIVGSSVNSATAKISKIWVE